MQHSSRAMKVTAVVAWALILAVFAGATIAARAPQNQCNTPPKVKTKLTAKNKADGSWTNNYPAKTDNAALFPSNDNCVRYPQVNYPSDHPTMSGKLIPFPGWPTTSSPGARSTTYRKPYIQEWHRLKGDPDMKKKSAECGGNWSNFQIHHILPEYFGGGDGFDNLVPLTPGDHRQFNSWWGVGTQKVTP